MHPSSDLSSVASLGEAPRSLTSLAFDRLRSDILSGDLRPREKLRVQQLAVRYDVGATAIREALSRLLTESLVTSEDQRGFHVADVSPQELLDLTRTRIWVEQTALKASIEQGDLEWETSVLASLHRLSRMAPSRTSAAAALAWRQAHRQFHFALIQGCGSPWTMKLCAVLYDQTERYRNLSAKVPDGAQRDVLKEHREIADAALARDPALACSLLGEHFEHTTKLIVSQPDATSKAS